MTTTKLIKRYGKPSMMQDICSATRKYYDYMDCTCENCGEVTVPSTYKYCPNCGYELEAGEYGLCKVEKIEPTIEEKRAIFAECMQEISEKLGIHEDAVKPTQDIPF